MDIYPKIQAATRNDVQLEFLESLLTDTPTMGFNSPMDLMNTIDDQAHCCNVIAGLLRAADIIKSEAVEHGLFKTPKELQEMIDLAMRDWDEPYDLQVREPGLWEETLDALCTGLVNTAIQERYHEALYDRDMTHTQSRKASLEIYIDQILSGDIQLPFILTRNHLAYYIKGIVDMEIIDAETPEFGDNPCDSEIDWALTLNLRDIKVLNSICEEYKIPNI